MFPFLTWCHMRSMSQSRATRTNTCPRKVKLSVSFNLVLDGFRSLMCWAVAFEAVSGPGRWSPLSNPNFVWSKSWRSSHLLVGRRRLGSLSPSETVRAVTPCLIPFNASFRSAARRCIIYINMWVFLIFSTPSLHICHNILVFFLLTWSPESVLRCRGYASAILQSWFFIFYVLFMRVVISPAKFFWFFFTALFMSTVI